MSIKKAVVTGGTGVTGNALVRYLLQQEVEVIAFIRRGSDRACLLPKHDALTIVECGLDEYRDLELSPLFDNSDVFFHLAWDGSRGKEKVNNRDNFRLQNDNVSYAIDAVELCDRIGCPVFVMTGSQAEYGRVDGKCYENAARNPQNAYGLAKMCAENMTRLLCGQRNIRHIWPILFSVYGPRDMTESMIDVSLRNLRRGQRNAYTSAEQMWNYLYSFDAAKALFLLALHGKNGEVYHVASKTNRKLKEYITEMYQEVGTDEIPGFGEIEVEKDRIIALDVDTSKLVQATGFVEDYSFRQGIRQIMENGI